jgi:hypothetical protein
MVHLILTGATGLVGSAVLSHILSLPGGVVTTSGSIYPKSNTTQTISKLTILTRSTAIPMLSSTPPPGTPRVNTATQIEVVTHKDFSVYDSDVLAKLRGADACIWALGISQSDVDAAAYVRITRDYALEAAKAFSTLRESATSASSHETKAAGGAPSIDGQDDAVEAAARKFKFIYISGEGATLTPKWYTPRFGRVKGETEQALLSLSQQARHSGTLAVYSARPAGVDALKQPWVWDPVMAEKRTSFQRTWLSLLLPPIALLWPSQHTPTAELGKVLVEMAVDPSREPFDPRDSGISGEGRTVGNVALRRFGGL